MATQAKRYKTGKAHACSNGQKVTVAALAAAKRLPVEHLRQLGLRDVANGVSIPYFSSDGMELFRRTRTTLTGKNMTLQPKGVSLTAYGSERIGEANKAGFLVLVEGESDCWALWHQRIPALGIPGANAAKVILHEHIEAIETIYISVEPDQGGETFLDGVKAQLNALHFTGKAFALRMPDGVKDPADLHAADPEKFLERFQRAITTAAPVEMKVKKQPDADGEKETPTPKLRCFAEIKAQPVSWLWRPWIARGMLNVLDGDPGLGKSTLTTDLAARISRGWAMPPDSGGDPVRQPGGVLFLSGEDSPEATIRPRLEAAGADMSRIHLFESVRDTDGEERQPVLPYDMHLVEQMIVEKGIVLVVVDPLMAFLDASVKAHNDQDVRRALYRLHLIAMRTGAANFVVRHLNKLAGGPALYRGGGSIGIVGAARCALVMGRDPADDHCRVLAVNKGNLAPLPRSLRFRLESQGDVARVGWIGECELTAADILEHPAARSRVSAGEQCAEAIRTLLAPGPMPVGDLKKALEKMGFKERAYKEGTKNARVRVKPHGFHGKGIASLPPSNDPDEAAADHAEGLFP